MTTPAKQAGLKIGDAVIVCRGDNCIHDFKVGELAYFDHDDGTDKPLFKQGYHTQYLSLEDIIFNPKPTKSPAQLKGLKEGDIVTLRSSSFGSAGYFKGPVFLSRDDGSSVPLFSDNWGNSLWLNLDDVTKAPDGPKAGFLWTDAPEGATHFSIDDTYLNPWHKQNDDGSFAFFSNDYGIKKFTTYDEYGQRHIKMETMLPMPGVVTKPNLTIVMADMREAIADVDEAQAVLDAKKAVVDGHLKTIRDAGFHVIGSRLTTDVPSSMWNEGDVVRCIGLAGAGLADLTIGKEYIVAMRDAGEPAVIDDLGDLMQQCVKNGCFKFVRPAK